jgi:hypothetical protein
VSERVGFSDLNPQVSKDRISREIRFEFVPNRRAGSLARTGGVYDLPIETQRGLLIDQGRLPGWEAFLPDFAIVLGIGQAPLIGESPAPPGMHDLRAIWTDLRVHVGGTQWSFLYDEHDNPRSVEVRRHPDAAASAEWSRVADLLFGHPSIDYAGAKRAEREVERGGACRPRDTRAPGWLLDLIRERTPWRHLIEDATAAGPTAIHRHREPRV